MTGGSVAYYSFLNDSGQTLHRTLSQPLRIAGQ